MRPNCFGLLVMVMLAPQLAQGRGLPKGASKKAKRAEQRCQQGHRDDCFRLMHYFVEGKEVRRDPERAWKLLRRTCDELGWASKRCRRARRRGPLRIRAVEKQLLGILEQTATEKPKYPLYQGSAFGCDRGDAGDCWQLFDGYLNNRFGKAYPFHAIAAMELACRYKHPNPNACHIARTRNLSATSFLSPSPAM